MKPKNFVTNLNRQLAKNDLLNSHEFLAAKPVDGELFAVIRKYGGDRLEGYACDIYLKPPGRGSTPIEIAVAVDPLEFGLKECECCSAPLIDPTPINGDILCQNCKDM